MAQQAALAFSGMSPLLECDITTRNTFIHFDDSFDDEDTLPVFAQRTLSGPAELDSMRRTLSSTSEEERGDFNTEKEYARVEMIEVDSAQEEALESNWPTHKLGQCVPCAYFILSSGGCRKGSQCDRCHLCTKKDLKQWKRTTRKAKNESRKLAAEAREVADQAALADVVDGANEAPLAEVPPKAADVVRGMPHGADDEDSDDASRHQRSYIVKNTFIHCSCSDDEEDEAPPSMRMCKSEFSPSREGHAMQTFRARLHDLLSESARFDGEKKRNPSSYHSSCSTSPGSTSPGPSPGRVSRCHSTTTSSSDPTEVGKALEEADDPSEALAEAGELPQPLASHTAGDMPSTSLDSSLETQGTSFEAHVAGKCQPCFYFSFKADGCRKGADCIYCHFCSSAESKRRKRTTKALAKQLKRADETRCC